MDEFLVVQLFKSVYAHDFGLNKCYQRLVQDLNLLIENGIDIKGVCKSYPVRVAQYRADKKEVHLLMRLSENFATSKYFSPYCYITQEDRKNAHFSSSLLPEKFGFRDKIAYQKDVEALQNDSNSHNLKEDSILNQIRFFHCARLGMLMPCLHHDIFAGCATLWEICPQFFPNWGYCVSKRHQNCHEKLFTVLFNVCQYLRNQLTFTLRCEKSPLGGSLSPKQLKNGQI